MCCPPTAQAYVDALTAWRFDDDGPDRWVRMLAEAAHTAAEGSARLADEIAALTSAWRERCAHRRSDSAAIALLEHLPAHPIITSADAIRLTGRSGPAARGALNQLTEDGVLAEVTLAKRNRAWESIGLFALVDARARPERRGDQRGRDAVAAAPRDPRAPARGDPRTTTTSTDGHGARRHAQRAAAAARYRAAP